MTAEQSRKLRQDYFIHLGINNPNEDQYDFIKYISDDQILRSIAMRLHMKGMKISSISRRYNVDAPKLYYIKKICPKFCKFEDEWTIENELTDYKHIYLMIDESTGYYKIGSSNNPNTREKTMQSQKPEIKLIFKSPLTYRSKEIELHNIFETKRIRGEWFSLDSKDLEYVKNYDYGIN